MRWIILTAILVSVVFIGTFYYTREIWDAMNAAGIVSFVYIVAFIYRITRPPVSPKQRWWTIGVTAVVIIGITVHWIIMYKMTHFQYNTLHTIHKVIAHGIAMEALKTEGLKILREYS